LQDGEIYCHILLIPEMGKESFFKGPMPIQFILKKRKIQLGWGADLDRIGLLGKPPAAEHSFPSKSQ
jgi:hypothetical protein